MHLKNLLFAVILAACEGSGVYAPAGALPDSGIAKPMEDAGADVGRTLCKGGVSVDGVYPRAAYAVALHETLPDMTFDTVNDDGTTAKLALHEYFEPCAARSRLLVLRTGAGGCGTCRWHNAHTSDLKRLDVGARLSFLDLVIADDDGIPPQPPALTRYRAHIDAPDRVAADPKFQLGPVSPTKGALPLFVFVDTRTMTVRNFLSNPDPQLLELRVRQELADLDHAPPPPFQAPEKFDGTFFKNQWDMLHDMTLPGAPPADPTNAKADDPPAAALGKKLYGESALSPSGSISCATCHDPQKQFNDGLPVSEGIRKVDRNAPALALAAHSRWQFWDGRADSLWAQALGPFENDKEFGSSRLFVAHAVANLYAAEYTAVFGALPPLGDTARFPASGKPGDAAYDAMATADKTAATRVFVNVGKAIAAYERTLRVKPNRLDRYIGGDMTALTRTEKNGLLVYFVVGCAQCHYGPRLTDDAFHVTRFPTGRQDGKADVGRAAANALLLQSDFLAGGNFSDQPNAGHGLALSTDESMIGAFKTPTLRGLPGSAPYGHGGKLTTLDDVAELYSTAGLSASDVRAIGAAPPWLVTFDHTAKEAVVPFLNVLEGDVDP